MFDRFFAKFSNNKGVRDKNGAIINDIKRRRDSKKALTKIKNGEIKLKPKVNGVRKHKVTITANSMNLKGDA